MTAASITTSDAITTTTTAACTTTSAACTITTAASTTTTTAACTNTPLAINNSAATTCKAFICRTTVRMYLHVMYIFTIFASLLVHRCAEPHEFSRACRIM